MAKEGRTPLFGRDCRTKPIRDILEDENIHSNGPDEKNKRDDPFSACESKRKGVELQQESLSKAIGIKGKSEERARKEPVRRHLKSHDWNW